VTTKFDSFGFPHVIPRGPARSRRRARRHGPWSVRRHGGPRSRFERLANPEPGNWLMNHHDYGSHRFSALDAINKTNVEESQARLCGPARRIERQRI